MPAPDGYRHHKQLFIRYGDLDRLSHVNNAKYLTYIEYGRISYFREVGLWDGGAGTREGVIVARTTVDYQLPLTMDDGAVDIWTRINRMGTKSLDIDSLILRAGDSAVAATGLTVVVAYDYQSRTTIAIPPAWRELITAYEPGLG